MGWSYEQLLSVPSEVYDVLVPWVVEQSKSQQIQS
jgi:hypothetical protein